MSKPDDLDPVSAPQLLFGTWQEVRDRHASQKQPIYQIPFEIVNGKDVLSAMNGDSQYQAVVTYANGNAAQAILEVKQGENVVFRKEGLIFGDRRDSPGFVGGRPALDPGNCCSDQYAILCRWTSFS